MKRTIFYLSFIFGGTIFFQQCKTPIASIEGTNKISSTNNVIPMDTILWNEHLHDFKMVPSGPPANTKYTFVNKSKETIKIDRVEVGCSCTASDYSKNDIKPNDTGWISASYKTANTFGYFRKHVDVFFTNGKKTHLILAGTVDPMIPLDK
jgi:hypothetical protein